MCKPSCALCKMLPKNSDPVLCQIRQPMSVIKKSNPAKQDQMPSTSSQAGHAPPMTGRSNHVQLSQLTLDSSVPCPGQQAQPNLGYRQQEPPLYPISFFSKPNQADPRLANKEPSSHVPPERLVPQGVEELRQNPRYTYPPQKRLEKERQYPEATWQASKPSPSKWRDIVSLRCKSAG